MKPLYTPAQFEEAFSRDKLPLQCKQCGKTFELTKHRIQQKIREGEKHGREEAGSYCNARCAYDATTTLVKRPCGNCGVDVFKRPSELVTKSGHVFCSHRCAATVTGRRPSPRKGKQYAINRQLLFSFYTEMLGPKPPRPKRYVIPTIQCERCGKPTKNTRFCGGTCRNHVLNKTIKGQVSKAEKVLVAEIKRLYPNLPYLTNDRKTLDGLELDLYFPTLQYAVEWNGIYHYKPVNGDEALRKIQVKDAKKVALCVEKGIRLKVIEDMTSHITFIEEKVKDVIAEIAAMT
jgi:hypothetical protein